VLDLLSFSSSSALPPLLLPLLPLHPSLPACRSNCAHACPFGPALRWLASHKSPGQMSVALPDACSMITVVCVRVQECAGTVGPPQPVLSFRLEAVPSMNYDPMANPPR